MRHGGFTIVELVIVMLLMAVLAGVGMARFADREPFAVQATAEQLGSALRLAQTTAVARRQSVRVQLVASPLALSICGDAACASPIDPPGGGPWLTDAGGLTASAGADFLFTADGATTLAAPLDLRVRSADGSVQSPLLRIDSGTGHVYQP